MGQINSPSSFEKAVAEGAPGKLILRLFVAGSTPRSQTTIQVLRQLIEERLDGNYLLEIVDIYQQPELARQQQILATPTLVKYLPNPKKIMIGDLSQKDRVLAGLGLVA
jgi:circadian clock protein KaiB